MADPEKVEEVYRKYVDRFPHFRDDIVLERPFPFERYKVHEDWEPKSVRLLFLAESPPWNCPENYFYNREYQGNLSHGVFGLLNIKGTSKCCQLHEFKDRGYFLVDTVMCVVKKTEDAPIPKSLVRCSGEHVLRSEIERISPKCILVLGSSALAGLKRFEPYKSRLARVTHIADEKEDGKIAAVKPITWEKTGVVVSPFPNNRNRDKWSAVECAFREAVNIAGEK